MRKVEEVRRKVEEDFKKGRVVDFRVPEKYLAISYFYDNVKSFYDKMDLLSQAEKYENLCFYYNQLFKYYIYLENAMELTHYKNKHCRNGNVYDKEEMLNKFLSRYKDLFDGGYLEYGKDFYLKNEDYESEVDKYIDSCKKNIEIELDKIDNDIKLEMSPIWNPPLDIRFDDVTVMGCNDIIKTSFKLCGCKNIKLLKYGFMLDTDECYNLLNKIDKNTLENVRRKIQIPKSKSYKKIIKKHAKRYKIKEIRKGGVFVLLENVTNLRIVSFLSEVLKYGVTSHVISNHFPESIEAISGLIEKIPKPVYDVGSSVIETTKNVAVTATTVIPEPVKEQSVELLEKGTKIVDDVSGFVANIGAPVRDLLTQVNQHAPAAAAAILTLVALRSVERITKGTVRTFARQEEKLFNNIIEKIKKGLYKVSSIGRGR